MIRLLAIFCMVLAWAVPVLAGDAAFSHTPGFLLASQGNVSDQLVLQGDVSAVGKAGFTNGLGSVSVLRTSLTADYSIFRLTYGLSHFSWDSKGAVVFAEGGRTPWENLHDVTLNVRLLNDVLDRDWHYWVNGELSSAFEKDFPGAVGAGFDGGVAYDVWNGWMVGVTAKTVAVSALRDDLFGDLGFGIVLSASQKTLREALKSLGLFKGLDEGSPKIGFSLALGSSDKTYRLSPDSPIRSNGYLGLVRSKVGAYLDYASDEHLKFSIGPEYHYGRRYKLYDSSGKLHSSHDLESAWGGYARLDWTF
jgi:hypothetical protein